MDSVQQVIAGIFTLLRRPSDLKLHPDDVLELLNDDLRGRVQDIDLGGREQRTKTVAIDIDEDDIDYRISLGNVPDFEAVKLEYGGAYVAGIQAWYEAEIVNQKAWSRHFDSSRVVGSFYGGNKLKLNIGPGTLGNYQWQLTYRVPLLTIVQTGERPPIPSNFLPVVKIAVALKAMPIVKDDSDEWLKWMQRTIPIYETDLVRWETRWREYLDGSNEPSTQPIRPWNQFRQRRSGNPRAYLPRQ